METTDKRYDVEFGDPWLTKWDCEEFIKGFRLMPPEMAEGKACDMLVSGGRYILPSGRVIHLALGHLIDSYKLGFEILYPENAKELVSVPGKLVFIKHSYYDRCHQPARYWNPGDEDPTGEYRYLCGACCGKEELPSDRPTLTVEMLEVMMDNKDKVRPE